jgi:hypothetical protein
LIVDALKLLAPWANICNEQNISVFSLHVSDFSPKGAIIPICKRDILAANQL